MHESLARFSENFASFLYGLNMNAFCVDFPEAPIPDSFRRAREQEEHLVDQQTRKGFAVRLMEKTTFLTTDTSFVDNPPTSSKATPKFTTPAPSRTTASSGRGGSSGGSGSSGRGIPVPRGRGGRASGLARGRGRGVR
ncbi:hypothetical protein EYC84_008870 [Monilinia fructicola]|uniref:DASH complex subunit DAM1 n=1 Tax=Monilinia fructicola TaxID=38448 RepID=A0A5M9JCE3_MONFR|nr:hypothetical protein EYC84_008870 [Monilinia fructicola]